MVPDKHFELSKKSQEFWGKSAVMQPTSMQPQGVIHGGNNPIGANVVSKTFIQRDYSEGTAVKFQEKLPEELNGKVRTFTHPIRACSLSNDLLVFQIHAELFGKVMREINDIFADAERLGARTYMEGCLGCLTAYLIFLCLESNYDKVPKFDSFESIQVRKYF